MRVKSRKPPAENFITSDCGDLLEVGGRADDVVGDQMRHVAVMASTRSWCAGVHRLDPGAEPLPQRAHLARPPPRRVVRQRRQDAPAVLEQLGEAGVGAGMFGAGHRMAGHEMNAAGRCGAASRDHGRLHRADIGDDGAGLQMRRHRLGDDRHRPPTGTQSTTRSASRAASAADRRSTASAMPSSPNARASASVGSVADDDALGRDRHAARARAIEEPIRPSR